MRGMDIVRLGLRSHLLPWLLSCVLGLSLLGGGVWFVTTFPWVPYRPICVIEWREASTLM